MRHTTIKEKITKTQGKPNYTQILYEMTLYSFSLESFSLTDLSVGGDLANATPACYPSTQFILQVSHLQRQPPSHYHPSATTRSSTVDFLHHQFSVVCGNANHSSHLSQWQKSSSKCEIKVEARPQPDVVQQQQIQALLASVEELTHQNEELRKTMES